MAKKNAGSRVFHSIMVVPCAFLCLMALISFSCFAYEHDKIRKSLREVNPHADYCILFMKSAANGTVSPGNDPPCVLAIWGEVCVFFLSIFIGAWFIVKAVIALKALSVFSIAEFGGLTLGALLDFTVAIVISAGLQQTCDALEDDDCSRQGLKNERNGDKFYFYQNINSAKATAWIGTATLVVMAVIYFILMSAYCYRKIRPKEPVPYDGFNNDEDENIEDQSDEKPVPV